MANEKITQGEKDMALRVWKIVEIHNGTMTPAQIATEKEYFEKMEVYTPTPNQLEKFDIASKAANLRELNKQLATADEKVQSISKGISDLPGAFAELGKSLSVLNS